MKKKMIQKKYTILCDYYFILNYFYYKNKNKKYINIKIPYEFKVPGLLLTHLVASCIWLQEIGLMCTGTGKKKSVVPVAFRYFTSRNFVFFLIKKPNSWLPVQPCTERVAQIAVQPLLISFGVLPKYRYRTGTDIIVPQTIFEY